MSKSDEMQILFLNILEHKEKQIHTEWDKLSITTHDNHGSYSSVTLKDAVAFIKTASIKELQVITLALAKTLLKLARRGWEERCPPRAVSLYRAADSAVVAYYKLQMAEMEQSNKTTLAEARRELALLGAQARLASDPKQTDKVFIHECWEGWRNNPALYASKAAFARDMLQKCEHVISQKKIEDWCRKWESNQAS